jgi:hypothetical protein
LAIVAPVLTALYLHHRLYGKRVIIIIDDDLAADSRFIDILGTRFSDHRIKAFTHPNTAKRYLRKHKRISLCLIDLIFRNSSSLSGVDLVEHCLKKNIKTLVITGHVIDDLGIQVRELSRMGLNQSHILKKPTTIAGYRDFLEKIDKRIK